MLYTTACDDGLFVSPCYLYVCARARERARTCTPSRRHFLNAWLSDVRAILIRKSPIGWKQAGDRNYCKLLLCTLSITEMCKKWIETWQTITRTQCQFSCLFGNTSVFILFFKTAFCAVASPISPFVQQQSTDMLDGRKKKKSDTVIEINTIYIVCIITLHDRRYILYLPPS